MSAKKTNHLIAAFNKLCDRKRPPSLKQLAVFINEYVPGLKAEAIKVTESTDRQLVGTRMRIPGKGSEGYLIEIRSDTGIIKTHNSAETYRHNGEIVRWIAEWIGMKHKEAFKLERKWVNW